MNITKLENDYLKANVLIASLCWLKLTQGSLFDWFQLLGPPTHEEFPLVSIIWYRSAYTLNQGWATFNFKWVLLTLSN